MDIYVSSTYICINKLTYLLILSPRLKDFWPGEILTLASFFLILLSKYYYFQF